MVISESAGAHPTDGLTVGEVQVVAGAVATAAAPEEGLTRVQRSVLNAPCEFLLGVAIDPGTAAPVDTTSFAELMRTKDQRLLTRIVQATLIGELLLPPAQQPAVASRVEAYANQLGVDEELLLRVRRLS